MAVHTAQCSMLMHALAFYNPTHQRTLRVDIVTGTRDSTSVIPSVRLSVKTTQARITKSSLCIGTKAVFL